MDLAEVRRPWLSQSSFAVVILVIFSDALHRDEHQKNIKDDKRSVDEISGCIHSKEDQDGQVLRKAVPRDKSFKVHL